MIKKLADDIVPVEERVALLKQLLSFSSFTEEQIKELSHLMKLYCYTPSEIIVREGEIIDSVYFIMQGEAEVNHRVPYLKKWMAIPVAVLRVGETIGLNDTGFYSDTGTRTATVVALTELIVLRLEVNDFHRFLRKHQLTPIMFAAAEQMLRMQLIKQALPFAKLSSERLRWLSERIEVVTVPARTVLFKQGEQGDRCFLIESGEVEIIYDDGENKRVLATLKRPMLFGEATFLSHSVRNATAMTVSDCHLLMLRYEYLSELMSSEKATTNMLMTLMVDRSRPKQVDAVQVYHRSDQEGNDISILKNSKTDDYFKLSAEGYYIWQKLDGKNTLQDITLALAEEYQVFSPDLVAGLISKLASAGFLENLKIEKSSLKNPQAFWVKSVLHIRNVFENRIALNDMEKWLQPTYHNAIRFLFTRAALIVFSLAILIGFGSFFIHTKNVLGIFSKEHTSLVLLLILIPYAMFEAFLHELGHAYAVKAKGREVHHMGVGWYWFVPFVYTDTSDMWVTDRASRIYVNFAGIFIDLLIAGMLAISLWMLTNPYVQSLIWLISFYTYISAFRMLNPLHDTDGYYLLMDTLEKNHLRRSSVEWLLELLSYKKTYHAEISHKAEIIYWLACTLYLFALTGLTWLIQHFVFVALNISVMHPAISLILPLFVLIFSCLSMIAEIRSQANE